MKIEFYRKPSGRQPVIEYIESLPEAEQIKVLAKLENIEKYGIGGSGVTCRHLKDKLWEIKIKSQWAHRIFYVLRTADLIILLDAVKKQKQKAEQFVLERAYKRMKEII